MLVVSVPQDLEGQPESRDWCLRTRNGFVEDCDILLWPLLKQTCNLLCQHLFCPDILRGITSRNWSSVSWGWLSQVSYSKGLGKFLNAFFFFSWKKWSLVSVCLNKTGMSSSCQDAEVRSIWMWEQELELTSELREPSLGGYFSPLWP